MKIKQKQIINIQRVEKKKEQTAIKRIRIVGGPDERQNIPDPKGSI